MALKESEEEFSPFPKVQFFCWSLLQQHWPEHQWTLPRIKGWCENVSLAAIAWTYQLISLFCTGDTRLSKKGVQKVDKNSQILLTFWDYNCSLETGDLTGEWSYFCACILRWSSLIYHDFFTSQLLLLFFLYSGFNKISVLYQKFYQVWAGIKGQKLLQFT